MYKDCLRLNIDRYHLPMLLCPYSTANNQTDFSYIPDAIKQESINLKVAGSPPQYQSEGQRFY